MKVLWDWVNVRYFRSGNFERLIHFPFLLSMILNEYLLRKQSLSNDLLVITIPRASESQFGTSK